MRCLKKNQTPGKIISFKPYGRAHPLSCPTPDLLNPLSRQLGPKEAPLGAKLNPETD